jgi:hypothetical protein
MAIVLVAVGTAVFVGRRRPAPPVAEPPPEQWAAAELHRLSRRDPNADALARMLRGFLDRKHKICAAGRTTRELLPLLEDKPYVEAWQTILERCDATRFSKSEFSSVDWSAVIAEAGRLTAETLPVSEVTGSAASGAVGEKA